MIIKEEIPSCIYVINQSNFLSAEKKRKLLKKARFKIFRQNSNTIIKWLNTQQKSKYYLVASNHQEIGITWVEHTRMELISIWADLMNTLSWWYGPNLY